jgi:hypothetical protein
MTASETDLRTLAGIVSDHRQDLPAAGLPPSLLADLMGQIRCDELTFAGFDSARRETWLVRYQCAGPVWHPPSGVRRIPRPAQPE